MNFQKMMENMKYAAAENAAVFGTPQPKIFVSERTPEGDLLVMRAHAAAREAIKAICPEVKVGLTLSLHDLQAQPGGEAFAAAAWEEEFTHYLPYIKEDDFLGVQNYTRTLYGAQGQLPAPQGAELTQMDYEFYPQALENVIRKVAADFKGDLIVTENGIATADDTRRVAFIEAALAGVQHCIADGIPVKGYFHWSLMDNFEWAEGLCHELWPDRREPRNAGTHPEAQPCGAGRIRQRIKIAVVVCTAATFLWYTGIKRG